jgi:hypothetical protein
MGVRLPGGSGSSRRTNRNKSLKILLRLRTRRLKDKTHAGVLTYIPEVSSFETGASTGTSLTMSTLLAVPLLLFVLLGVLLALVGWGVRSARLPANGGIEWHDDLLVGMLILAGIAGAVLLTYLLLGLST